MPLVNGYYYPTLAEWNTSNGPGGGGSSGTIITGYVSGSAFQTGSAASPGIQIGQGAGLFQLAPRTLDIAVSGTSMIHVDPGSGPYLGIVQVSGPFYTDGTSPMLQLGSGAWGSGLISFPNGLHVRSNDGYLDHYLTARSMYTSGQISGSEDSYSTLIGSMQIGTNKALHWWNSSRIQDVSNGVIMMTNMSTSSFGRLILGANSANSASLVAAGTTIKIRNGNDTADASLTMAGLTAATANVTTVSSSQLAVSTNLTTPALTASNLTASAAAFNVVTAATGNFGFLNYTTSGAAGTFTDLTASSVSTPRIVSQQFNKTGLGNNDYAAMGSGTYVSCDFMGDGPVVVSQNGLGFTGNSIQTPGSVPTYPAGFSQAMMANHPGAVFVGCSTAGDAAAASTSPSTTTLYVSFVANALTTYTMNHIFLTPLTASSATERYTFAVGSLCNTNTQIFGGFYLEYSDNLNSGNWILCENGNNSGGGRQVIANSSTPFTTGSWNKLTIQQNGVNVTASLNGSQICAGPSVVMKQAPPTNNVCMAIGGIRLGKSTTAVSSSVMAWLDYSSLQSYVSR